MVRKDLIFVTLVYRNYSDLDDFCLSIKENVKCDYRIVVVDAFYDNETSLMVENRAKQYDCDYFRIENKGYGYGNNRGIDYANDKYGYEWLAICNADTILKSEISAESLAKYDKSIIAPMIVARHGKNQNPYWAIRNKFSERLIYNGFESDNRLLFYLGVGINKIFRGIFRTINLCTGGHFNQIYACHGSFFIAPKSFLDCFRYDEDVFLFYEEAFLAIEAKQKNVKICYSKEINVSHKEDGSMSISDVKEYSLLKESYKIYYLKHR